ncbi:hypothetical protein BT69DRAFT_1368304 [Atractiella rhizophila]|nr:hypothetical protein BT69DRAFT_1368304 [Atractiella rhizophila]
MQTVGLLLLGVNERREEDYVRMKNGRGVRLLCSESERRARPITRYAELVGRGTSSAAGLSRGLASVLEDHFPPPPPPLPESGEPEFDYSVPEQQADPKLSILDLGWKKDWVKTQGGIQQAVTMALNKREELSAREWTKRHKEVKKVMKQEGMHRAR